MAEAIPVEIRQSLGKRNMRRMRGAGQTPAVLYGHGKETVSLAVPTAAIESAIRRGSRYIEFTGALDEGAMVRELQWNTWGSEILHIDFIRASADEKVTVSLSIELRGEAPGIKTGGVVEHLLHEVAVECSATNVPEKLLGNINSLELGDMITLADIKVGEGVVLQDDLTRVVAQCVEPVEIIEEEESESSGVEPEVIGQKEENDE
jgi:large subunit ribosomal protein L25